MRRFLLVLVMICACAIAHAQDTDEAAIRTVIAGQTMAWNRGDIGAFMQSYEDSPQTTFVGADAVRKGYQSILGRYRKTYATRAQMGTLSFSNIEVRLLPGSCGAVDYAIVTGNFHLARKQKGKSARDSGIFSLVWHKGSGGWKIVLDHTG